MCFSYHSFKLLSLHYSDLGSLWVFWPAWILSAFSVSFKASNILLKINSFTILIFHFNTECLYFCKSNSHKSNLFFFKELPNSSQCCVVLQFHWVCLPLQQSVQHLNLSIPDFITIKLALMDKKYTCPRFRYNELKNRNQVAVIWNCQEAYVALFLLYFCI